MNAVETPSAEGMGVAALAYRVGVNRDTVRHYERIGLLPVPARTSAGYRRYGEDALQRLRFIKDAQRLGLRLREIRQLLEAHDAGVCPCEPAEPMLHQHLADLDREIERLTALRRELARLLEAMPEACPPPAPDRPPSLTVPAAPGASVAPSVASADLPEAYGKVACTLAPDAAVEREQRWHRLRRTVSVEAYREVGAVVVRLRVDDGTDAAWASREVAELAALERQCCSQFDWHLDEEDDDTGGVLTLRVRPRTSTREDGGDNAAELDAIAAGFGASPASAKGDE